MARQGLSHPVMPLTFEAGVDLSGYKNRFVSMSADGQIDPTPATGAGFLGILYDIDSDTDAPAAGDECYVLCLGVGVVEAAEAITPGQEVASAGATGKAVVVAATERILGIALEEATADGQLISVLIVHGGIKA